MKRCLVAVMTFLALGSPVWANDVLTISGQDLNWDPTSQPSPQFTVGIANGGDTDLLIAWSVLVEIVPVGSASGLPVGFGFGRFYGDDWYRSELDLRW